jgi:Ca2+-binding EF-hand superfamily protein
MEEELYLKILTQIDQRGLTIHDAFKRFDTDNNGFIEFLELLEGFKNIQIKVSKNE